MSECHSCGRSIKESEAYARIVLGGIAYLLCCPMCVAAIEAGQVQRRMIPQSFSDERIKVIVEYLPALLVGGDYACIQSQGDNQLLLLVADVSGHGIAPSLVMSRLSSEIEHLADGSKDVAELASALNNLMGPMSAEHGFYLTLFASVIDFSRHTITYANCGHPPQLLWSQEDQLYIRLEPENLPVGLFDSKVFGSVKKNVAPVRPGDRLWLFTDGLLGLEENNSELGEAGVLELFQALVSTPTPEAERYLSERIKALQRTHSEDDVLSVLVELLPDI